MAVSKKYAGLPDLDLAPEIYETPELTDDASTIQTSTLRTESPHTSEDEDGEDTNTHRSHGLDRRRIDRDAARTRFNTAVVDARGADFSDSVAKPGGLTSSSYRSRSKRSKTGREKHPGQNGHGSSSEDDGDLDESFAARIARLRREVEEVRLELETRDGQSSRTDGDGEGEFQDSVEEQYQQDQKGLRVEGADDVKTLSRMLDGLDIRQTQKGNTSSRAASREAHFTQALDTASNARQVNKTSQDPSPQPQPVVSDSSASIESIVRFADRLSALESVLGVSTISASNETPPILPLLTTLSTRITNLSTTLSPTTPDHRNQSNNTFNPSNTLNLELLSTRFQTLTSEADKLTQSRQTALQKLGELHEARLRYAAIRPLHPPLSTQSSRPSSSYQPAPNDTNQPTNTKEGPTNPTPQPPATDEQRQETQLFLAEQASKISALYTLLPMIQNLQPLLPLVLDRLRSLSVIHAGAADVKSTIDEIEKKQADIDREIGTWREAIERVETGIEELEETMKDNADVIGRMVRGVEKKVDRLMKDS